MASHHRPLRAVVGHRPTAPVGYGDPIQVTPAGRQLMTRASEPTRISVANRRGVLPPRLLANPISWVVRLALVGNPIFSLSATLTEVEGCDTRAGFRRLQVGE